MLIKPVNLITYILAFISWSYSFSNGALFLYIAIGLLFHAYMSCDTIEIRNRS